MMAGCTTAEESPLSTSQFVHIQVLASRNGETGLVNRSNAGGSGQYDKFVSFTNFTFEVKYAVKSPEGMPPLFGFVYTVKTTDELVIPLAIAS
uniref:Uncharacterized protein n=1 Tax=Amphimedon queenslandica TaxID=400682 RepID=A0A1X7UNC5_AMPQE